MLSVLAVSRSEVESLPHEMRSASLGLSLGKVKQPGLDKVKQPNLKQNPNVGALRIRIGFGGPLDYNYNTEPSK